MLIAIEGIIGAGKTTLANSLAEKLGFYLVDEPVSNNPYLEDFYKDPPKWAAQMQFWLVVKRSKSHLEVIKRIWETGVGAFVDRSIYGDSAFAWANHFCGNISDRDMETYLGHLKLMKQWLRFPNILVYLDVKPEQAMMRIKERGRTCEQDIPIGYLDLLYSGYERVLKDIENEGCKVIRIDWSQFQTADNVIDILFEERCFQNFWHGYKTESTRIPETKRILEISQQ